jgi:Uma2 family endonuclease
MLPASIAEQEKLYTVEEYFELEKSSDIRHEYYYGKLIPMPGESKKANLIASNCNFHLRIALKGKGYRIFQSDVRTIVKDKKIYRYPDIVIAPKSDDTDDYNITKPILLIEVFSDGSSKTDHEAKLKEYAEMESVQYYLIISQYEMSVKIYTRQEKGWHYDHLMGAEDIIDLPLLGCPLLLKDIYEEVDLAENRSDS